jgi:D-cysteine desulfhydrase
MIPLHARWPALLRDVPHIAFTAGATPVERFGTGNAWIKRDDRSADGYGGNKPRKLEFLLAGARKDGADRILTVGGTGSNHCLATCLHGTRHGFAVELLLIPQPVTEHVRMSLRLYSKYAARMIRGTSYEEAETVLAERRREHPALAYFPIGGSTPLGALGFVNAALELADQVKAGALPEPETLVIAAGTCGTLAGMVLGLAIAGLRTRVQAVRVVDRVVTHRGTVDALVSGARDILARTVPELAQVRVREDAYEIDERYYGAGYGHATPEGTRAIERFAAEAGLPLEPTYTGKTAAAFLDTVETAGGAPVLYWHTFAGPVLQDEARAIPDEAVPAEFREFLK